jgi:hypothetical protein
MAHELIRSLPAEALEKLDRMLIKETSAVECAQWLHAQGLCSKVNSSSLARAVRRYKLDEITVHEAARREALSRAASPVARKALREKIDAYQMHADWVKLLDHRRAVYEKAADAVKNAPGIAALSDTLRRAARDLHDMYRDHTRFLMDAGLIPRAPQQLHVSADLIVVHDHRQAVALLEALSDFYQRQGEEPHPWLSQVQTMASGETRQLSKQTVSDAAIQEATEVRRRHADEAISRAERRVAELTTQKTQAEPDSEAGVPVIDEVDELNVEVIPHGSLPPARGRTIDAEVDDMPSLESNW